MTELKVSKAKILASRPARQGQSEHKEVDQPIACAHTVVSAKSEVDEEDKLEGKEEEQATSISTVKPMIAAML